MATTKVSALAALTTTDGAEELLVNDGGTSKKLLISNLPNTTTKGLYEMANTISSNYSISSGNNAISASPITINSGVSVTIPSGSTWVLA